ncbi:N-acetylmuramoyl-L-alanine amidase AmiC precursor [Aminobacter sp. MSH1]|uniref:N-acetylmuramoyl-L-alanine amidase n=1 Tax=Aminobacter sp. MSH1 TaxID=374606 RepID=UPI000D37F4C6|nr:N-acetylmuramoyl-L-alanine amidase [Aminobacter sp. MSH1]AWC24138.1 N-acetylmuramoyl-L-alanine amidase AmiC precursor [Aminobacter sp. MSH1]
MGPAALTGTSFPIGGSQPRGAICRALLLVLALFSAVVGFQSQPASAADAIKTLDYKMAGDATHMRIVMNFDREPEPRWFLLRGPHRLVVDLPDTSLALDAKELKPRGLIKGVRYGTSGEGASRLIVTSKGPFNVEKVDILRNENGSGYRMVADIGAASEREFDAALAAQAETTGSTVSTPKSDRVGKIAHRGDRPFTIVLDPGHGGIDGGAEGLNGTVEKSVTLAFAQELKAKLAANGAYKVVLTREGDDFLRLDDRVRIARQAEADLFISIHADTIRLKGIRGATVYTVSDKASDADAQALADRENLSDQLAGVDVAEENHEVSDILVDLIRRETHGFSTRFARSLVGELSPTVGMINNPHRSAGFRVLKAPDVPSVLVELGYLSNPEDEEQLRSADWREKAASSISKAVAAFVAGRGSSTGG